MAAEDHQEAAADGLDGVPGALNQRMRSRLAAAMWTPDGPEASKRGARRGDRTRQTSQSEMSMINFGRATESPRK